jgi:hypothetical protein
MAEMGANTVRVYTLHPPAFYNALAAHNAGHPDRPLWLMHGVWAELPPDDHYYDEAWQADFFGEMERIVDVIHGRADVAHRPGHASGYYTADVSRWTLGIHPGPGVGTVLGGGVQRALPGPLGVPRPLPQPSTAPTPWTYG